MREDSATPGLRPFAVSRIEMLASVIVAALAFLLANVALDGPDFNPDESRWLSRAHYLAALGDPFGPTWADQYMTRGQPPLGSYAMGLGLLLQGRDLETNPPWDFSLTWEENIARSHKPVAEDLTAGRRTSAALVALTAVALIAVGRVYVPMPWAIAGGAFYAVHPFTTYIGSIAMSDALFGLLIALAALAAVALAHDPGWKRAVLLGAVLGLGGATKLSPLAVAAGLSGIAVVALAGTAWRRRAIPRRAVVIAALGLVVGLAAVVTFVAVYPYLWPHPVERTRHLFAFRAEEMAAQAADWPVMAVPDRAEALRRVGVNFSERFNLAASLAARGGGSAPSVVRQTELLLPLIGVVVMAGMAVRAGAFSPRMLALAVLGGQVLVTILGMRSEFDRYHVPMALLGAIAAAVALDWLARAALWMRGYADARTALWRGGGERRAGARIHVVGHWLVDTAEQTEEAGDAGVAPTAVVSVRATPSTRDSLS